MTIIIEERLSLDPVAVATLRQHISGEVVLPNEHGYDAARQILNGRIDRHPALIVRCRSARDVAQAIVFARDHQLPLAVRGGGHNTAGLAICDDGLVVDLTLMKQVAIDPVARIARVEPGVLHDEIVLAAQAHGLATPTGTCATVGVVGATLGGGLGWLGGRYGLAIDNVRAFELVTADGQLRSASADSNPDLFWALRGGGGNFGVVTAIEYQLHPVSSVYGGMLIYPLGAAREPLQRYRDLSATAPDALIAHVALTTLPEIGPAMLIQACYAGEDLAEGERALAPLRTAGTPLADMIGPMAYSDLFMMLTPPVPAGRNYYDTAYSLVAPGDAALDTLLECAAGFTSPFSSIVVHQIRGAASRVAPDATAFALREPHFSIVNVAAWDAGPDEPHVAWGDSALAAMRPYAANWLYVNFMGQAGKAEVQTAYRGNYARLLDLKRRYDPANLFRRNQNIA
jgi:hypothetical protein